MVFENESDAGVREAATARVLQRRATNPGDRHVLRVVAEEFGVREQTLREWVADGREWERASAGVPASASAGVPSGVAAPFAVPSSGGAAAREASPAPVAVVPVASVPVAAPAESAAPAAPKRRRRPRFSPVVTTRIAPVGEASEEVADPARLAVAAPASDTPGAQELPPTPVTPPHRAEPAADLDPARLAHPGEPEAPAESGAAVVAHPPTEALSAPARSVLAALEAEAAELRRGNDILKGAIRVVLGA